MRAQWRFVAFPLILPWRPEFWSLPLYFPDLKVGVLRQWPKNIPYGGKPLPPGVGGGEDLRDYNPGELKQWQAYKEYSDHHEEVDDIVRALRGEKARPEVAEGPWHGEEAASLAWQLEVIEADQEAQLARVDRGEERLEDILAPETWEEPESDEGVAGEVEMVDPETARRRYLLWRKEMGPVLGAGSVPLLLGRSSPGIFTSLRKEIGTSKIALVRLQVPVCRDEEAFQSARKLTGDTAWGKEFQWLLGMCLTAADQGADIDEPGQVLSRWLKEELPRQWPEMPSVYREMEIWGRDPGVLEGEEALITFSGARKKVVAG